MQPQESYPGRNLATVDVSLGRIAAHTITLEQYREGTTVIEPFAGSSSRGCGHPGINSLARSVDVNDPRLLENYKPHTQRQL